MTPKEKANELYENMLNGFQFTIDEYTAKQCALIAVDEILNMKPKNPFIVNGYYIEPKKYWQQVKQKIELL